MNTKELTFTKSERRVLILLLSLTVGFQFFAYTLSPEIDKGNEITVIHHHINKAENPIKENYKTDHHSYKKKNETSVKSIHNNNRQAKKMSTSNNIKPVLFHFDPNTIDSMAWINLGVKHWTVKTIIKYRNKGGTFKTKEDLGKIYGLHKETLNTLLPYCKIEKQFSSNSKEVYTKIKKENLLPIDINKADTTQLKTLNGIGTKLSSRIVKYRKNIGGFHSIDQLTEIYGLKPEVVEQNRKRLKATGDLRKIDINAISKDSLAFHFYFDYKLAKAIINYRYQHGPITKVDDLKKIKSISASDFEKIKPYITVLP